MQPYFKTTTKYKIQNKKQCNVNNTTWNNDCGTAPGNLVKFLNHEYISYDGIICQKHFPCKRNIEQTEQTEQKEFNFLVLTILVFSLINDCS